MNPCPCSDTAAPENASDENPIVNTVMIRFIVCLLLLMLFTRAEKHALFP
jgi:hypothetical protein